MTRLDEIEARAKAGEAAYEGLARGESRQEHWSAATELEMHAIEDVPWLCERLRDAMALLTGVAGNTYPGPWSASYDALLAAVNGTKGGA